ncbi:uncharacterized protein LOC107743710 [Sinocyclocheilus rhinocerous]|uniref:uncharacterized protein LOC107743710 n=1 Tax=Sinocyclocheilus rhinocerous TaxID=307959 RepID=UPI0007B853A7|nr:PREDICTED: uncharacterized protein LOC107743710 [Sinocyclocheilus rhinocerous]
MQGYTWSSNQHPSTRYQDQPPPQYQERLPPPYQEWPPPQYQEQFTPKYLAVRNDQPNAFQVQLIPQLQTTLQTRYSNGQQEAANQWSTCSGSADSSAFQPNSDGYNWLKRTNQINPQYPFAASNTQQHYPSDNSNAYRYHAQFMQWHDSSPQNYRNTGCSQAQMYHGSSVGNSRGWSSHISNNGSSCSMNNQQQLQPPRMAPLHHHQQQQEFSRRYTGKKRRRHTQYSSRAHNSGVSQKNPNNQVQSRTEANHTSCNSTTPPQSNVSLPSNNVNQSPVNQKQSELGSNAGPNVSATQSQNNQNAAHQSQGTSSETYNTNQTSQMTKTSEAQLQPKSRTDFNLSAYADSIIYRLLCSNDNEQANKQQSDERITHQNTRPEQSEVCATKRTENHSKEPFSEPREQCTVEPHSKRMKYVVFQRDCRNKETIVSKDISNFGVLSAQPGTHQTSSNENRLKGMSQHNIQYSTDAADCLEVVFALQKAAQQTHKAIAIVPPIYQQISNAAPMADTSPQKADSPLLKIDSVWSLVEESNEQKTVNDKLSESSSQMAQQDNKSLENATASNMADPDTCSASPVECQNYVQQSDSDSDGPSFDLSSVPVIEYTLEKLMELVKSIEMKELSAGYPEKSQSILERILKLYWNGKASNMLEPLKSFREALQLSIEYAKDYGSVVFKSIETENLKKLAHCDILKHETYSWSEEFRSSWLNVDGQPADIEKVLSEALLDDLTVFKATSQSFSDNTVVTSASLGVNSLTDMPEVSPKEKSVNPDTCSPTDLFMQMAGNDRGEVAAENNGHSYVVLRKESEKETFKKQEDINQNQIFNIEPSDITPLAERSTERLTELSNAKEVFRQDHEQTCDNVSDSLSLSPGDSVSDGVKNSLVSFSTETHCSSMDTWQVEDISDDENTGSKEALNNSSDTWLLEDISDDENTGSKEALNNSSDTWLLEDISDDENTGSKEALNNSSDTWLVEDISDDENTGNIEALNNSSDTWLVEDISDDENSGNKDVLLNSSNTWQVENISDNENPGNMDIPSNSADICAVENESTDENSSDDSLFMGITVLSSEDAKTFFQHIEKDPECTIKTKSQSKLESPDLVACFDAPSQLNQEYNKAHTCSRCGTQIVKSNSTNVTKMDSDADLFCLQCWEQAPLFELEEEPCSPMTDEVNLLGYAAKSNELGQNDRLPCLKLEVNEPNVASTKECIAYEGLKGQKNYCLLTSDLGGNCSPPCLKIEVKELTVAPNDECIADEGLAGQKSVFLVKSEQGHNCSLPSLELKVKKPNVAPLEACIAEEGLMGQKRDRMVKSELVESCCPPSLELEIKEPTVASTTECIADEGQKSDRIIQSELRQNCSLPSLELEVEMPNVSSPEECIADKGPKRDSMAKSKMRQNHCSPSLELEVKEPTVSSAENCIADKGLTRQKIDSMVKSVTETMSENQGSAEWELTKIQPNKQKNEKNEKIRVPKPQSFSQCRKSFSKKTAFSKHKLKSGSTSTGSDDSVLFAPDIIVKMNWPQKKNQPRVSANKRCSGESQKCSKVKKCKEHRQERHDNHDRTSTKHRENLQKVTEKVSGQSSDTPPHGSEKKLELHGILSVNKMKRTEPKKVRFDLYGSKTEKQYYTRERHFTAPATLTVSDCKDYTDVISAKQKVHNQWSSTFIPKTKKTCPPRSPQESGPQKKKPQKPQDLLKSNMSALRNHLTHRAKLLSSSDIETSHLRKPYFHQKLTKTLSS